jgi:HSF-type DNA-binding
MIHANEGKRRTFGVTHRTERGTNAKQALRTVTPKKVSIARLLAVPSTSEAYYNLEMRCIVLNNNTAPTRCVREIPSPPLVHDLDEGSGSSSKAEKHFPSVLHRLLEEAEVGGYSDIVAWQPHGRSFLVKQQARFVREVMPRFFRQTRYASFQRQLSLYCFCRLSQKGADHGAYYHPSFLRGPENAIQCEYIRRQRIKGCGVRQSASPETEPYVLRFVQNLTGSSFAYV